MMEDKREMIKMTYDEGKLRPRSDFKVRCGWINLLDNGLKKGSVGSSNPRVSRGAKMFEVHGHEFRGKGILHELWEVCDLRLASCLLSLASRHSRIRLLDLDNYLYILSVNC